MIPLVVFVKLLPLLHGCTPNTVLANSKVPKPIAENAPLQIIRAGAPAYNAWIPSVRTKYWIEATSPNWEGIVCVTNRVLRFPAK